MKFRAALLLSSLVCVSSLAAQTPVLVDHSESGDTFRFEITPAESGSWSVIATLGQNATWENLDFEVQGAAVGSTFHFEVRGATKPLRPATSIGVVNDVFRWNALELTSTTAGGGTFTVDAAPRERFLVRLEPKASVPTEAPYYTWARYIDYMTDIIMNEPDAQVTQIGTSIQGRAIARIVIDYPSNEPKKTVLMGVRQHGDEFGSSYLLEGALDYLLGRNGATPEPELREKIRWIIYPLMNPDGAVNNVRWNSTGTDLNRDWLRAGANAAIQEPETFVLQTDIENFEALYGFDIGGDHHGWGSTPDGGFRYAQGQSVSFVSASEYQEAKKDTDVIAIWDPTQTNWIENGGTLGMLRAEIFLRYGFLLHTPEYNSFASTEAEFRVKGEAWLKAMLDTLYAPEITDSDGVPKAFLSLPGDTMYVTVDDLDENQQPGATEFVFVTVVDEATGDTESLELSETGTNTGIFRNNLALPVVRGAAVPGNGILESADGSTVQATYTDNDFARDSSSASVPVLPRTVYRRLTPQKK